MGKKRVAIETKEELLKSSDKAEKSVSDTTNKKKSSKILRNANIYIRVSYNNVRITITNENGDVLSWSTSGSLGFKGPRKSTPYAASKVVEAVFERLGNIELEEANILIRGIGGGRDTSIRSLVARGISIASIQDITPVPHNGCRPRKARRV